MHRLVLYFAALAIASSALAQDTSLLRCEGADRVQKVVAAAKKEGSFMLYTSFAEKDLPRLTAAFEKRYGVKVRVWRSASEKVLQRAVIETGAGRHEFDAPGSIIARSTAHRPETRRHRAHFAARTRRN